MSSISAHAQAAKMIKQELKKAFPGVNFSVTSESYSMGNSVDVWWEGGPERASVNEVVKKYQCGSFNGMEDTYEYNNRRDDIPQVMFVFTKRVRAQ